MLPFKIEYSKTGNASCHKCNNFIAMKVLRIGKQYYYNGDHRRPPNVQWYHELCFNNAFPYILKNISQLDGFEYIGGADQTRILGNLPNLPNTPNIGNNMNNNVNNNNNVDLINNTNKETIPSNDKNIIIQTQKLPSIQLLPILQQEQRLLKKNTNSEDHIIQEIMLFHDTLETEINKNQERNKTFDVMGLKLNFSKEIYNVVNKYKKKYNNLISNEECDDNYDNNEDSDYNPEQRQLKKKKLQPDTSDYIS